MSADPTIDIVIAGAGPAGLACAITATERGGRVVLLDKSDDIGGTLHLSTGQMSAAGTRRQRERGVEDDPEQHFAEIMARSREESNPALVHLAVHEAPKTVDWLEDIGLELDPETPSRYMGHEPYATTRTYWPADGEGGPGVLRVMRAALQPAIDDGRVEVLTSHRVEELIEEDGRVVGVRASGPDGPVERRGHAVVLTTGGYGADPELYAELSPHQPRLICACRHTSTGDGLRMARDRGAVLRGGDLQLQTVGVLEPEPGSGRAGEPATWTNLNPNFRRPLEIHVNERGERFLAEDNRSPDRRERALMAQPGQRCWVVFDEHALQTDPFAGLDAERIRALAAEGKSMWSAPDLETLAQRAGIEADGLRRTVEAYNAAAAGGTDPLGRAEPGPAIEQPPFYAALVYAAVVITFGGVAADESLRVLRADGTPIPGLYGAGEVLGAAALNGNFFWGGMAVTPAMSFGRVLGRTLVGQAQPEVADVA